MRMQNALLFLRATFRLGPFAHPHALPWALAGSEVLNNVEYHQGYQSMLPEEKRERQTVE